MTAAAGVLLAWHCQGRGGEGKGAAAARCFSRKALGVCGGAVGVRQIKGSPFCCVLSHRVLGAGVLITQGLNKSSVTITSGSGRL